MIRDGAGASRSTGRLRRWNGPDQKKNGSLIGYARVSTDDQDCAAQVYELREAGCREIITEQASGADRSRPALARLLSTIAAGDTLVIVRLDRLARSVGHLVSLLDDLTAKGAGLRSLNDPIDTTSAPGRFVLHILGAVAELERALIQERTRAGVAAAARAGRLPGHPGLRARDPAATSALAALRSARGIDRARAALEPHLDAIAALRPGESWNRVAIAVAAAGGPSWSGERLRCTMARLHRNRNVYRFEPKTG